MSLKTLIACEYSRQKSVFSTKFLYLNSSCKRIKSTFSKLALFWGVATALLSFFHWSILWLHHFQFLAIGNFTWPSPCILSFDWYFGMIKIFASVNYQFPNLFAFCCTIFCLPFCAVKCLLITKFLPLFFTNVSFDSLTTFLGMPRPSANFVTATCTLGVVYLQNSPLLYMDKLYTVFLNDARLWMHSAVDCSCCLGELKSTSMVDSSRMYNDT